MLQASSARQRLRAKGAQRAPEGVPLVGCVPARPQLSHMRVRKDFIVQRVAQLLFHAQLAPMVAPAT